MLTTVRTNESDGALETHLEGYWVMKTLVLWLLVWPAAAFAQGTVTFCNLNGGAGLNAPIYLSDGTTKMGVGFTAELMAGPSASSLASMATTGFLTGGGAGYFNGGAVSIPSVQGGSTAFLQVRVWSTSAGSFAAAMASNLPNTWGMSSVFSVVTGNPYATPPGLPAPLTGLQSFSIVLIPEPSALALIAVGAAFLLSFRRT